MKLSKTFVLYTTFAITSIAQADVLGLNKTLKSITINRFDIPHSRSGKVTKQECFIFSKFVANQIDIGEKGAHAISVRPRQSVKLDSETCVGQKQTGEVSIPSPEQHVQYVLGSTDQYLFVRSADSHGNSSRIWIYDIQTAQQVFETDYDLSRPPLFSLKNKIATLKFSKQLKLNCPLLIEGQTCWESILKDNNISATIGLKMPTCSKALASLKATPDLLKIPGAIQIFAPAKVQDLTKVNSEWISGQASCNETP